MVYIGATELTSILPQNIVLTASSTPLTLGEVATVCAEVSAELDAAAAGAGYAVPVPTGATAAFAQMQRWTKQGVGGQVLKTLFPNLGGPANRNTLADDYWKAYQDALKALRKGELVLVGAGSDSSESGRELARSYSTSNPAATVGVSPTIDMGWAP